MPNPEGMAQAEGMSLEDVMAVFATGTPCQIEELMAAAFRDLHCSLHQRHALTEDLLRERSQKPEVLLKLLKRGRNIVCKATGASPLGRRLLFLVKSEVVAPQIIMISATKEVALQRGEEVMRLRQLQVQTLLHMQETKRCPAHVVIGTPGKVQDAVKRGLIKTSSVSLLIVDGLDMILDEEYQMGAFVQSIRKFLKKDLQVVLFAATISPEVRAYAKSLPRVVFLQAESKHVGAPKDFRASSSHAAGPAAGPTLLPGENLSRQTLEAECLRRYTCSTVNDAS